MSQIIDFYRGYKVNSCRHQLSDIWTFSFQRMEQVHDYIQWMFPLDEPSNHNPEAPILTKEDIEEFKRSPKLRWSLLTSVHTYMRFLDVTPGQWVTEFDHNHLRITRMLKCLMLMGMELEARARLDEVMLIVRSRDAEETMAKAIGFWREAVDGEEEGETELTEFEVKIPQWVCKDCGLINLSEVGECPNCGGPRPPYKV